MSELSRRALFAGVASLAVAPALPAAPTVRVTKIIYGTHATATYLSDGTVLIDPSPARGDR